MERALTPAALEDARALIARVWLGAASGSVAERVGAISLRPHQRDAVRRLRATMNEFGGALLADDVGLGKTYVAAAIIREAAHPLVVCPASLRDMWRRALDAAEARAAITSYSALSRGRAPDGPLDLLVLDEAHHARTPGTRRYAALTRLAAHARVLALSATPIHNSRDDLAALLALFLGERAGAMSDAELARCVVRREHADLPPAALPALDAPRWITVGDDEPLLRLILALPPPVPPCGGGDGGVLVAWGLVRQWASSRAALRGAVHRRLARAAALEAAMSEGRYPTARELTAWTAADDSIQLAFPALVASAHDGTAALLDTLRVHQRALRDLLATAGADPSVDGARAARLRELRGAHVGERIVAFSQFTDTVHALYRALAPDGGVAALSAQGARVAGGALSIREALARFSPRAVGAAPPRACERIDLLITTDLLSEGLDLGDASVVVHLDLPWTPARMEQRVGRSRRLGAPHTRTAVYAFAPPAGAECLLDVERRLREKLRAAGRMTGVAGAILPSLGPPPGAEPAAARARELVHRAISLWERDGTHSESLAPPVIAAGRADRIALLLLARDGERPVLAASVDHAELTDDPHRVLAALELASQASPIALADAELARARGAAERWLLRRRAAAAAGDGTLFRAMARRAALRRIAAITARAPHHRRALIAPLAATARRIVTTPFGLGAEHVLEALAGAPLADEAWLRALTEFGAIHSPPASVSTPLALIALLVISPQ